jgi:hypothetical protein
MKIILFIFLFVFSSFAGFAQTKPVDFTLEAQAGVTSRGHVPFWMRSNQYGSNPVSGPFGSVIAGLKKEYNTAEKHFFDWGFSGEARVNGGKESNFILTEAYGKIKLGVFELKGGRIKESFGISDTLLTSGTFAVSGNAPGIPKIQISIPQFYSLPFAGKFFAIKGNFAHGWMGNLPIQFPYKRVNEATSYFHQKSLYLRLGKPQSSTKLYLGLNDNAIWGNNEKIFPKNEFTLSPWQEYSYVVLSKKFEYSQVGNHLGTVDLGFEHRFPNVKMLLYRQSFFDKDALKHFANISDGLNGLSFTNLKTGSQNIFWEKFVIEILSTKNQAADSWSRLNLLGYEDYYNNYIYTQGWSYKGLGLGTPFVTQANLANENLPSNEKEYFINNRVLAFHAGVLASIKNWKCTGKFSYSLNYGTYSTTKTFGEKSQLSVGVEARKEIKPQLYLAFNAAFDQGKLYDNSGGLIVKLAKTF